MNNTEFVGANRLSQVLASIKQAGIGGAVADGKSIRLTGSGKLELTGFLTGVIRNNIATYNEYNGLFGITQNGLFKFSEIIEGITSEETMIPLLPQPDAIFHFDSITAYTLEEIKEFVLNSGDAFYLFSGSLIEMFFTDETYQVFAFFDLSVIINSEANQ